MDYFSNLEFVCFGNTRKSNRINANRYFDGYYGLQFILSGEIMVDCEGSEVWQSSGPLVFFTSPGRRFTYGTPCGFRHHFFICFKGERVKQYIDGGLIPEHPGVEIPITAADELTNILEDLIRTLRRNTRTSHGEAVLMLEKALLLVANQPENHRRRHVGAVEIRELAEKIAEHPEYEWDFRNIVREYGISEVHFRRLFVQETGSAPLHYVLLHRVHAAAGLLLSTDMRIKEIAYQCGFGGEFYFSRQFRKIMNMSPSDYRKNIN